MVKLKIKHTRIDHEHALHANYYIYQCFKHNKIEHRYLFVIHFYLHPF